MSVYCLGTILDIVTHHQLAANQSTSPGSTLTRCATYQVASEEGPGEVVCRYQKVELTDLL